MLWAIKRKPLASFEERNYLGSCVIVQHSSDLSLENMLTHISSQLYFLKQFDMPDTRLPTLHFYIYKTFLYAFPHEVPIVVHQSKHH